MTKQYAAWTNKEVALLEKLYPTASNDKLMRELYPHPLSSILSMAYGLDLRKDRGRRWMDIAKAHSPVFRFPTSFPEAAE